MCVVGYQKMPVAYFNFFFTFSLWFFILLAFFCADQQSKVVILLFFLLANLPFQDFCHDTHTRGREISVGSLYVYVCMCVCNKIKL